MKRRVPLKNRLIGTMILHVSPLPDEKYMQAQIIRALTAAYKMGRRDARKAAPKGEQSKVDRPNDWDDIDSYGPSA